MTHTLRVYHTAGLAGALSTRVGRRPEAARGATVRRQTNCDQEIVVSTSG